MTGKAIIAGGSVGGLFTAAALSRAGWEVQVFERSPVPLAGRGAGIVTHPELVAALQSVGADTDDLGVTVHERVAYDLAGARVAAIPFRQVVTSWDRIYQVLRPLIPEGCYNLDCTATGYAADGDKAVCRFDDGATAEGDILVAADGFRSAIRGQMLPSIRPLYSGYLVWRTLAAEADVPAHLRDDPFSTFGFFIPNGTQIIGYPIAGPGNDLRPGNLRYNFVWYAEASQETLDDMLTDTDGVRHEVSIPPPAIRQGVIDAMYADARARLPAPFNEILAVSERPFFTPIYDHHCPVMAQGRVALAGDAACVARPHVGMGVTKAAQDALALAEELSVGTPEAALARYSGRRVGPALLAHLTARRLGGYVFDGPRDENSDGRSHPMTGRILRETAVIPRPLPPT